MKKELQTCGLLWAHVSACLTAAEQRCLIVTRRFNALLYEHIGYSPACVCVFGPDQADENPGSLEVPAVSDSVSES